MMSIIRIREKMKNYIQEKNNNKFFINGIKISMKSNPSNISVGEIKSSLTKAIEKIPGHLLKNLNAINIGNFLELKKRKIQSFYKNSSIFMTSDYEDSVDMIDDLVHEVAHSVEEIFGSVIYSDQEVEKEFLNKRKKLWRTLREAGFDVELSKFLNPNYNQDFDLFLYKEVGYAFLRTATKSVFYSPYGSTSLREYFANGFEAFFMKEEIARLKKISPVLYKKMINLLDIEGE